MSKRTVKFAQITMPSVRMLYVSHADFAALQSGEITLAYPILRTSLTKTGQ